MSNILKLPTRELLIKCMPKRKVVAEIGVHVGAFTSVIAKYSMPRKLHLIDPWEHQVHTSYPDANGPEENTQEQYENNYQKVIKKFSREIQNQRIKVHRGYSESVLSLFPASYFDWVYVDGDHSYDTVKKDLNLCGLKVKREGLICGDDYIQGNRIAGERYGVIQAVDEFCMEFDWVNICFADHLWEGESYLNFVLARKEFAAMQLSNLKWRYRFVRIAESIRGFLKNGQT